MARFISVVIPVRNGAATLGACLAAACASRYAPFEVIVVDDASQDDSAGIAGRYPCRVIRLPTHAGAARARNVGAARSRGEVLFFTDADCLLQADTLALAAESLAAGGPGAVVGGTYTPIPHDRGFFSVFQSAFIHYSETRRPADPDYVATHAMAIEARTFRRSGGFAEGFLPILEDVELSHRLRGAGHRLVVNPRLQVQHIFNFSLRRSLRNAVRKSLYWTKYSLARGDLLADSGTASAGLKTAVAAHALGGLVVCLAVVGGQPPLLALLPPLAGLALFRNRGLIGAFHRTGGARFAVLATLYYVLVYPLAVGAGALAGLLGYLRGPTPSLPA